MKPSRLRSQGTLRIQKDNSSNSLILNKQIQNTVPKVGYRTSTH
jgi:hypothetical protein